MSPDVKAGVVAYLRVSTEEQGDSKLGLEAQRAAIQAEVAKRGWTLVATYEDVASGKSTKNRPGLAAALDAIYDGDADCLVVAKLDRLARSVLDTAALLERAEHDRWALVSLDYQVDTSTPMGEAMTHQMAVFAQLERRLISQRTKEALAAKKAQGAVLGAPRQLDPDLERGIVAMRRDGMSYQAIADALNQAGRLKPGGKPWSVPAIQPILARNGLVAARGHHKRRRRKEVTA